MSSPDQAETEPTAILVAPREIVDLISRLLRIHGVDPGTAHDIATDVMHCQVAGYPAVEYVIAAFEHDKAAAVREPHDRRRVDPETLATAYRSGVSLSESVLRHLERAAAGFLVAEHVLDSIADDPTVG